MTNRTIIVNLFSGPGTGKSTNAAGLFSLMKCSGYKVELIAEYAKELVYDGNFDRLKRQDLLHKEQNKRQKRLLGHVDFAITDSPILMALPYIFEGFKTASIDEVTMKKRIVTSFNSYNNFNFFLERVEAYQTEGRYQTESEAIELDKQILGIMDEHKLVYHRVAATGNCPEVVLEIIKRGELKCK